MTPIDASTDEGLLDFVDSTGKSVEPLGPPGFFHNFGDGLGDSLMAGLARTGRAAAMLASPFAAQAQSEHNLARRLRGLPDDHEGIDWYFRNVVGATNNAVDFWTPDAANVGTAGRIVNGLAQSLVPLAAGGGNPAPLLATTMADTPTDLVNQGVDANTALSVAGVQTLATAAGFKLPAAVGPNLFARLATGAGANLAIGEGTRLTTGALLDGAGHADLAQQYRDDPTAAWTDLGMGLVFGGLSHLQAPHATRAQQDAVLTANNAHHFQHESAPGVPADGASSTLHQTAMETAVRQFLNGERPDLSDVFKGEAAAEFLPSPQLREVMRAGASGAPGPGEALGAFDAAVGHVLTREGGFANDAADRGGVTNFGISSRAHPGVDVANLTREDAKGIYRRDYWDAIGADALPGSLRGMAFDAAVNQGVGWTKQALKAADGDPAKFLQLREAHYREIVANDPSQAKFLRGWLNRLGAFKETTDAGRALRERMVSDPEQLQRDYAALEESKGGTVLNTDTARELAPEYLADRTRSADVHEAASDVVKTIYEDKLAKPTPAGFDDTVLFTAGGTGAGKTTAIRDAGEAFGKPEIVYDTNMSTTSSAIDKIEQALAAKRKVQVAYVYRDPVEALTGGAIPRARSQAEKFGSGRTVPLDEHAKTHIGVRPTMEALAARYADDPRVQFIHIDNSRGRHNSMVVPSLESLPAVEHNQLRERLQAALEAARSEGLDPALYRGFAGSGRPAGLAEVRLPERSGVQRGGQGQPSRGGSDRPGDGRHPEPQRGQVTAEHYAVAAHEALAEFPDLLIADADGSVRPASDVLKDAEADAQQQAQLQTSAIQAAVNCFLRSGT